MRGWPSEKTPITEIDRGSFAADRRSSLSSLRGGESCASPRLLEPWLHDAGAQGHCDRSLRHVAVERVPQSYLALVEEAEPGAGWVRSNSRSLCRGRPCRTSRRCRACRTRCSPHCRRGSRAWVHVTQREDDRGLQQQVNQAAAGRLRRLDQGVEGHRVQAELAGHGCVVGRQRRHVARRCRCLRAPPRAASRAC